MFLRLKLGEYSGNYLNQFFLQLLSKQFKMVSKLDDDVHAVRTSEVMTDFDEANQTLVDYFAIIGPEHD